MSDQIKSSFAKVKEDISSIKEAINILSDEISNLRNTLETLKTTNQQTDRHIIPTIPTQISTHNYANFAQQPLQASKTKISDVSTRNNGVPTDRQTNQQTDRHITNRTFSPQNAQVNSFQLDEISRSENLSNILESLDTIKRDLRSQFKKLTPQEMQIFSLIYQLEEQGFVVDYSLLSEKTSLTESSIRDYTLRLIKKGIPLEKHKENNKHITLKVSSSLKRIANLSTIKSLREL